MLAAEERERESANWFQLRYSKWKRACFPLILQTKESVAVFTLRITKKLYQIKWEFHFRRNLYDWEKPALQELQSPGVIG